MRRTILVMAVSNIAWATVDTFGTGVNQFTIDFVSISGDMVNGGAKERL